MKKKLFTTMFSGCLLLLSGCSSLNPTMETLGSSEVQLSVENTTISTTEAPTTEAPTTELSTTPISIEITTTAPETTTSSSGHMEENSVTYDNNNVHINYPMLLGMTDVETQDWANEQIYEDIKALLKYYDVDEENDTFTLDYEVSTIYRSEFSLVYTGELKKANGTTVKVTASEDLDLSNKEHIRLANRLTAQKIKKSILGDDDSEPDYTILVSNVNEEIIKTHLSQQDDAFFANLVSGADFGAKDKLTGVFSYNYMNSNVAIVIPLPHVMGDYTVISIKQKTK